MVASTEAYEGRVQPDEDAPEVCVDSYEGRYDDPPLVRLMPPTWN